MAGSYMGNMTFGINFDVSQGISQLKAVQTALTDITKINPKNITSSIISESEVKRLQTLSSTLSKEISKAFNVNLGQLDFSKLNFKEGQWKTFLGDLSKIGPMGYNSFNNLQRSLTMTNDKLKVTHGFLDKMVTTFSNTIRWSIATKAIQTITGSIQKAYYFTKDLDTSLNDIRIVTSKSAEEMEKFALQATKAAQALGKTTTDYTKASLIFYQQGLGDKEVAARAETTLKAANVTGQSTSEVSEQLTAVWNGYRVTAAETEKYVDKLSAVAANTASNLEELSTGMSKVASAANMMGVDIDQLNAQLSTIISVTRQAPETIGAAMKTVYARMSTIQAGGINEEDGATLKSYTEKMNQFGISVLDANGKLRDMGDVIEEIGGKWDTFSREAQVGLAQAMGGTRQYSNLTALFENWDKYQSALKTSQNAEGTLQKQQDIYMDSIEAHLKQLAAEAENLYQTIFDSDAIKDFSDILTKVVETVNNIIKGFGGVNTSILMIVSTVANALVPKLSQSVSMLMNTSSTRRTNNEISQIGIRGTQEVGRLSGEYYSQVEQQINNNPDMGNDVKQQQLQQLENQKALSQSILKLKEDYYRFFSSLSEEQKQAIKDEEKQLQLLQDQSAELAVTQKAFSEAASRILKDNNATTDSINAENKAVKELQQTLQSPLLRTDYKNNIGILNNTKANRAKLDMYESTVIPETADKAKQTIFSDSNEDEQWIEQDNQKLAERLRIFNDHLSTLSAKQIQKWSQALVKAIDKAKQEVENSGRNDQDTAQAYENIKGRIQKLNQTLNIDNAVQKEDFIRDTIKGIQAHQNNLNKYIKFYETNIAERLPQESRKVFNDLQGEMQDTVNQFKDVDTVLSNVNMSTKEGLTANAEKLKTFGEEYIVKLKEACKELGIELDDLLKKAPIVNAQQAQMDQDLEIQQKLAQRQQTLMQQRTQGYMQATTAVSQFATAITGLINAFSNLDNMKPHEFLLQMLITVPMLINSFNTMIKSLRSAGTAILELQSMKGKDTVTTVAEAGANEALAAGEQKAAISANTLGVALKTAVPILAAIAAVIGTVIAAFKIAEKDNPFNQISESLATAKKRTEDLKQQTDKLKTTYDNLISAFEKFDEASKVMEEATTSTEEYRNALNESNEAIIQLINNNAKLAKYFERDSTGRLVLKEGVTEEQLKNETNAQYMRSQRETYQAQMIQNDVQYNKDILDILKNNNGSGIKAYASFLPSTGTLGFMQGTEDRMLGNEYIVTAFANVLTKAIKEIEGPLTQEEWVSIFEKTMQIDKSKNERVELSSAIINQLNDMVMQKADRISQNDFYRQEMARNFIEERNYGNYSEQSLGVQSAYNRIFGQDYANRLNEKSGSYQSLYSFYSRYEDNANAEAKINEIAQEKANALGATGFKIKDGKISYLNGKEEVSSEDITSVIHSATIETLEDTFDSYMKENSEEVIKDIQKIDNKAQNLSEKYGIDNLGNAITAALSGDTDLKFLQNAPREMVEEFKEAVDKGEVSKLLGLTDEDWDSLGENAEDEFEDALKKALDRDYSLTVAIQTELSRTTQGMAAFHGLQQEWYDKKSISDESVDLISDWLTSEGHSELVDSFKEAVESGKWENIAESINKIKAILDKDLPLTEKKLDELKAATANQYQGKLNDHNITSADRGKTGDDFTARQIAQSAKNSLNDKSTVEDIKKAIKEYEKAVEKAKNKSLKDSLNADIATLQDWQKELESSTENVEELTDVLTNQENEVFNVVNQADGLKEAMGVIGEGWKVAAEDAQTFTRNCRNAELYIEKVNEDGSLQINEAGISDMAQRQFEDLRNQIAATEAALKAAQQEASQYTEGSEQWIALNEQIERQVELLSILRAAFTGLQTAITTAGTNHSSSSKQTKNAIDGFKTVLDIYHDIDIEIKKITHDMAILEKQSKYLTDKKLEKNLQTQLKLYQEQNKALQERIKIAVNEAATLRSQKVNDDGTKGLSAYGIKFNKNDGEIENYFEIVKKKEEEVNAARLKFNKSRSDADEKYYNKVKKELDDLKNDISEYEKYLDDRRQMEEQLYDNLQKQLEIKLEHADLKIQAALDTSKVKKQILEFQKEMGTWTIDLILNPNQTAIDAVTTGAASRNVITSSGKTLTGLSSQANELIDAILFLKDAKAGETVEWNGEEYDRSAITALVQKLEEIGVDMQDVFGDIKQTVDDAREAYINALQEWQNWNEKLLARYDMKNNMFDHADKLTSLLYGEDSMQAKIVHENIATQKVDNLYAQAQEANRIAKEAYDQYEQAILSGDEKVAQEAYDIWATNIEKINSLSEQLVEARINQYKMQVERITKEFDMAVLNGESLEEFTQQWDLINKQADQYLDTINAEFGVEQLRNKYAEALNKTTGNTKAQKELTKIMNEELGILKEKDKLTKYDLERAEAKYDLAVKQLALEEARENKTNLRLRRDSQGNYTYQYAANQDEILKAEQEYAIAQNNLYNMDKERVNQMADEILDLYQSFADERDKILTDPQYINDQEAMNAKLEELQQRYFDQDNGLITIAAKEYVVATQNIQQSVDDILNKPSNPNSILSSFNTLAEKGPEAISEFVVGLNPHIADVIAKFAPTEGGGTSSVADGLKSCWDACKGYQNDFLTAVEDFADKLDQDTALGGVLQLYGEAKQAVENFKNKCEEGTDLTDLNNVTAAINTLASALYDDDKKKPNLTGNADKAWTELKNLVNPDQYKDNLDKISNNFINLTNTVNGIATAFTTANETATTLFQLLDEYNDKKWSFKPDISVPTGSGGGQSRPDGTGNTDDDGDGPIETPQEPEKFLITYHGNRLAFVIGEDTAEKKKQIIGSAIDDITEDYDPEELKIVKTTAKNPTIDDPEIFGYNLNANMYYYWDRNKIPVGYGTGIPFKLSSFKKFDTGGYTGVWGDQGKLAMLHEKELVLNKEDTTNLLEAIDIMRKLDLGQIETRMYESFLLAQQRMAEDRVAPDTQPTAINQTITINADFPDASDRDEIRAAFDSLVNMASQRAFTKRY